MNLGIGRGLSSSPVGSPKGLRTGFPSFQSGTSPQPDSRRRKRKPYFQYFSFDFFSMASLSWPSEPCEPNQMLGPNRLGRAVYKSYERADIVPGCGHDLSRCQFIFIENLPSHRMQGKANAVVEGCLGRRYYFSSADLFSADLFSLATALGSGKWLPGPSCGSERVGAPGNSNPSATISMTRGVWSFRLGTELPGLSDRGGEALIEAPSEDELLEECPVAQLGEPDYVAELELEEAVSAPGITYCALGQQLIGRPDTRSRLRLRHPANLEGGHIVSDGDLPRVRNLHLRAKNAGGGGILLAGPRVSARLKNGDGVRTLFRLSTLILSEDFSHHPAIN
ncbi:hypothetical protein Cgig2_000402 [Carnegiea gigantea]|uniref:Uncharacterized protein n=1 Tax=Carnegiea gigantea TaxID=171969 RepID=A0A9Q1QD44_9CARY|nr:hypothetical protein Cgig2_000402 [Carnegiea gigantea]